MKEKIKKMQKRRANNTDNNDLNRQYDYHHLHSGVDLDHLRYLGHS